MAGKLYTSDFLVIGSGLSGLMFALKAVDYGSVTIVTKNKAKESSTYRAQGGLAAVVSKNDSFESHIEDTIRVGAGLCHRDVVESFIRSGPRAVEELTKLGVNFCKDEVSGDFELGLEGGHTNRRVLHVKDHTGQDIELALLKAVESEKRINLYENHIAVNLITRNNRVYGAYVLDANTTEIERYSTKVIVIATGGAGRVFLYTSNPDIATGDGIAMAYRAGASVMNLEFVQFHPTLLYHHRIRSSLISEALRGEGAILLGSDGQRFMPNYHEDAELAPRDIVARAIDNELKRTGAYYVWLDISFKPPDYVRERFPAIYETCLNAGIDITAEPIPVVPAAHYVMGGVRVDVNGRSDVEGLFVIGEAACTGFHGGNRMASNSLLETAVLALNAVDTTREIVESDPPHFDIPEWDPGDAADSDELILLSHMWDEVRRIMANYVGIVRSNKRLIRARNRIDFLAREINQFYWDYKLTPDLVELRNIVLVAELIIRMARMRNESRGAHYNKDHPNPSDQIVDTVLRKGYEPISMQ